MIWDFSHCDQRLMRAFFPKQAGKRYESIGVSTGPPTYHAWICTCTCTVVFELITHSVPTVDQFLRVEWTAAFPLWTLNLAQRDTVHGAASHQQLPIPAGLYRTDTGA